MQFRGMDQAHEEVPDLGAVEAAIEQRILPVKDRLLQRPLTDVVAQRCTRDPQKQG
jgi:hypothetical protein